MKPASRRVLFPALILAVIPAVSAIAGFFRIGNLSGMEGLLLWMPDYRRLMALICAAGFIPLAVFAASRVSARRGRRKTEKVLLLAGSALSVALTLAACGTAFRASRLIHTLPATMPSLSRWTGTNGQKLERLALSADSHIGNPASDEAATRAILETVRSGGYDAFFHLGDIAEMGMPGKDFENAAPLIRESLGATPFVSVMGNHDALIGGEWRYRRFFNPDLEYRLDSGTTHIIAVNLLWGGETFDKKQRAWLGKNLASIPESDTTIVISHCFVRSSGYREPTTQKEWFDHPDLLGDLAPILENGGVDLVVSGHNHFMEYIETPAPPGNKRGTAYAIVGAMGGKNDPERTYVTKGSVWYRRDGFGFLDIDLSGGSMKLTFRDETGKPLFTTER